MEMRPRLCKDLNCNVFREYYYLKEELTEFCREEGLSTLGGKLELTERIAHYLDTGKKLQPKLKRNTKAKVIENITIDSLIEDNFVCSEKHRKFFKEAIGESFSFKVKFQKWLKENAGKTYKEAIEAYCRIINEKENSKKEIDKQFEYNTYIRDFFAANKGRTLKDAIKCWKYKKSLKGNNKYDEADLSALEDR